VGGMDGTPAATAAATGKKPRVGEEKRDDGLPERRRRSSQCWPSGIGRAATQPPRAVATSPSALRVCWESEPRGRGSGHSYVSK
jgi:hypothetical protein